MKTNNFSIELMVPDQEDKDITFNESLLKVDQFLNNSINGFINDVPDTIKVGDKFVISEGDKKNQICFLSHDSKEIEFLDPVNNIVVFSIEERCFFLYENNSWNKLCITPSVNEKNINNKQQEMLSNFTNIADDYTLPSQEAYHFLYMAEDCVLSLEKDSALETTIIIKQNVESIKHLTLPDNIIWENNSPYNITKKVNQMDIIKLFRIAGSFHFIGKIVSQGNQF